MSRDWRDPYSKAEIEAARRAARDEAGILEETFALLRRFARSLPFTEDVLAAFHCVRDPTTSPHVRFLLLAALAYFVLPLDAIPDLLPVVGFSDDAAVIATTIAAVRGAITPEHRAKARASLDESEYSH